MPDKPFEYCRVCRLNHNKGKGHKFSRKHRQRLESHLSKALLKIRDIAFFLSNPTFLRDPDRGLNSFWCSFCDTTITELDSTFACSNTLMHLASTLHVESVKKFFFENGADTEKRHLFSIESEELVKWEDACKALAAASMPMEVVNGAVNNIHSARSSVVATVFDTFSASSCPNSHTSDPLPFYKDGNSYHDTCEKRACRAYGANISSTTLIPKINGSLGTYNNNLEHHLGLTCSSVTSSRSEEGNIHSGALPPWLQAGESTHNKAFVSSHDAPFLHSKERQSKHGKRVGAAWADKRRAEMQTVTSGQYIENGSEVDKDWLPNFGGVWQSGSRRETRKEFEAQRQLGRETPRTELLKTLQPYISKRQRLNASANVEPPL